MSSDSLLNLSFDLANLERDLVRLQSELKQRGAEVSQDEISFISTVGSPRFRPLQNRITAINSKHKDLMDERERILLTEIQSIHEEIRSLKEEKERRYYLQLEQTPIVSVASSVSRGTMISPRELTSKSSFRQTINHTHSPRPSTAVPVISRSHSDVSSGNSSVFNLFEKELDALKRRIEQSNEESELASLRRIEREVEKLREDVEDLNRLPLTTNLVRSPIPRKSNVSVKVYDAALLSNFKEHIICRFGFNDGFKQAFKALDVFDDGQISESHFIRGLPKLLGFHDCTRNYRKLFSIADIENKGFITLSQWMRLKSAKSNLA
jgi:hypothetical protein